jgi:hypothetical protein
MTEAISDKYLGLPTMVELDRSKSVGYLLERIIERLNGWKRGSYKWEEMIFY